MRLMTFSCKMGICSLVSCVSSHLLERIFSLRITRWGACWALCTKQNNWSCGASFLLAKLSYLWIISRRWFTSCHVLKLLMHLGSLRSILMKLFGYTGCPKQLSPTGMLSSQVTFENLWHKMGNRLQFSTAFYLQTNGQTEVVNRSLDNLLRCLVGENLWTWDLILPTVEFAYNSSVNRSIRMSPFEVV